MDVEMWAVGRLKPYPDTPPAERRRGGRGGRVDPGVRVPPAVRGRRAGRDRGRVHPVQGRPEARAGRGDRPHGPRAPPDQARAYRLADNQTATLSAGDDDRLAAELAALQSAAFDLALTGFPEVSRFAATFGPAAPVALVDGGTEVSFADVAARRRSAAPAA
jgi:hypothetical protein